MPDLFQSPVEDSCPTDPRLYNMFSQFPCRMMQVTLESLTDLCNFIVWGPLIFTLIFGFKSVQHG